MMKTGISPPPQRCALPPQGGDAGGPAKPDPRALIGLQHQVMPQGVLWRAMTAVMKAESLLLPLAHRLVQAHGAGHADIQALDRAQHRAIDQLVRSEAHTSDH